MPPSLPAGIRRRRGTSGHLEFADGAAGELDLSELISFRGVFAPLRDEVEFAKVRVEPDLGTIVWPTGADLCPDVLYSRVTGQAIVGATTEENGSARGTLFELLQRAGKAELSVFPADAPSAAGSPLSSAG